MENILVKFKQEENNVNLKYSFIGKNHEKQISQEYKDTD